MDNNEAESNDSIFFIDKNKVKFNQEIYSLFNSFLVKESKSLSKHKLKEIMPEYSDIDFQIQKKVNDIRNFYDSDPIFRDMQSNNSFAMTLFRKGFKEMFFGPKGIVTRKSTELKNYHKAIEPKIQLNSKINVGSLDYYDYLTSYNSFFERLKNSRKKMLKINGNFYISNIKDEKLHTAYNNFVKKKKNISNKNKKGNSTYYNKLSKNINPINNDSEIKAKTQNYFYNNTYGKIKNNLSSSKYSEQKENIFLNYKKDSENIKNSLFSKINRISNQDNKINSNNNNTVNYSIQADDLNVRKNKRQKTEIYPTIRKEDKHFTNITTISNKNSKPTSIKGNLFQNLILKTPIKKKKTLKIKLPKELEENANNSKINFTIQNTPKKENTANKKNLIENYFSNKSLKISKYSEEKNKNFLSSIKDIKLSLKNRIDSSMPKNKKFQNSLNKFINNSKRYELKKKDLLKKRMKEELLQLKEDMQNTKKYNNDSPKNVDFSDIHRFSPKSNHKVQKRIKGNSYNLAFSVKSRLERDLPIKEFLYNIEKIKEKEKEKKFFKYIRTNFKKNIKVIHNLTISLDNIKKKYNY